MRILRVEGKLSATRAAGVGLIGLLWLAAGLIASGTLALGHSVEREDLVYVDGSGDSPAETQCVRDLTRLSDGNYDRGFLRGRTQSLKFILNGTCNSTKAKPSGAIIGRNLLYKKKDDKWRKCRDSKFIESGMETWEFSIVRDLKRVPCGWGLYKLVTGSFVKFEGAYRGGYLDPADGHYLPAN